MNTAIERMAGLTAQMKTARERAQTLANQAWKDTSDAIETLADNASTRIDGSTRDSRRMARFEGKVTLHVRALNRIENAGASVRADAGRKAQCPSIVLIRIAKEGKCRYAEAIAVHDAGAAALEFTTEHMVIGTAEIEGVAKHTRAGASKPRLTEGPNNTVHMVDNRSQAERDRHQRHVEGAFERIIRARIASAHQAPAPEAIEATRTRACAERWAGIIIDLATEPAPADPAPAEPARSAQAR